MQLSKPPPHTHTLPYDKELKRNKSKLIHGIISLLILIYLWNYNISKLRGQYYKSKTIYKKNI